MRKLGAMLLCIPIVLAWLALLLALVAMLTAERLLYRRKGNGPHNGEPLEDGD